MYITVTRLPMALHDSGMRAGVVQWGRVLKPLSNLNFLPPLPLFQGSHHNCATVSDPTKIYVAKKVRLQEKSLEYVGNTTTNTARDRPCQGERPSKKNLLLHLFLSSLYLLPFKFYGLTDTPCQTSHISE
jgi:hypothetical protein